MGEIKWNMEGKDFFSGIEVYDEDEGVFC